MIRRHPSRRIMVGAMAVTISAAGRFYATKHSGLGSSIHSPWGRAFVNELPRAEPDPLREENSPLCDQALVPRLPPTPLCWRLELNW